MDFTAPFLEKKFIPDVTVESWDSFDEIKTKLDEWGFVVVKGILSDDEQIKAEEILYSDLLQSVSVEDISSTKLLEVYDDVLSGKLHFPKNSLPGLSSKGFLSLMNFPQGEFSWTMRKNAKVRKIYSSLHNCPEEELCVSMDVPFFTPEGNVNKTCKNWCHADQNINIHTGCVNSYQGILYVWDSTEANTSNTIVIPKSHKNEYNELLAAIPESMYDGHSLYLSNIPDRVDAKMLYEKWDTKSRRIPVPAGGLLIFNSKTIHQGYQSGYRLAQTICWEPKECRSQDALKKKMEACHMGIATTHWASLGIHHGVSFIKPKPQEYNVKYHMCVFPLKKIKNVTTDRTFSYEKDGPIKNMSFKQLREGLKEEYFEYL